MSIENMKNMKAQLISCVQGQMANLDKVEAKQLGQAVDMIKDLSEAIYYCTITQAMEKTNKQENRNINYYTMPNNNYYYTPDYTEEYLLTRDREKRNGQMYYPSSSSGDMGHSTGGNPSYYTVPMRYTEPMYGKNMSNNDGYMANMPRDPREGRAAVRRRMYMEGKEKHNDPNSQLKELEAYLQELSTDITEMIKGASPEEKATLHQKITMLANKMA